MLIVEDVTKTYGKKETAFDALKNINLQFEPGTTTAIIGKSGSGKSTLLHILTGLDHPTKGDIKDDGKSVFNDLDTDKWRGQSIGVVFQQFFLQPNNSVLENVALPLKIQGHKKKERLQRAKVALEKVGLTDRAKNRANDLSGGQKQRVAIARALVTDPSLLIADEPTGNLDSENSLVIEDLLFDLNKKLGTTIVIVTHDEDLAQRCQKIIRLHDGTVQAGNAKKGKKKL